MENSQRQIFQCHKFPRVILLETANTCGLPNPTLDIPHLVILPLPSILTTTHLYKFLAHAHGSHHDDEISIERNLAPYKSIVHWRTTESLCPSYSC